MKTWGIGGIAPPFLTSTITISELSASRVCCFAPEKKVPNGYEARWAPKVGLDIVGEIKILPL
jgi:hypothetical protein